MPRGTSRENLFWSSREARPEELQEGYALEQAVEIAAGLMREQGMSASEAAKTASPSRPG